MVMLLLISVACFSYGQRRWHNDLDSQTRISFGAGVMEQSRMLGTNLAVQAGLDQYFSRNLSIRAIYQYAFLDTGTAQLHTQSGEVLNQPGPGSKFQQLQLMGAYTVYTWDEEMAFRIGAGAARQISGPVYPTFALDIIGFSDKRVSPVLSWSPVIRGDYNSGEPGWNHSVTLNFSIRLD